jgi:hypothetical protein
MQLRQSNNTVCQISNFNHEKAKKTEENSKYEIRMTKIKNSNQKLTIKKIVVKGK